MKTLYLIRHAKSDWANITLADIDRPLNTRGYTDAHKMSAMMKQKNIQPDAIVTSPAVRAIFNLCCIIPTQKTILILLPKRMIELTLCFCLHTIR